MANIPPGTSDSERQDSHRRILRAALAVFGEYGFEGATTREIARRADVHQPAIAYHFSNKVELWKAAARHAADAQIGFLQRSGGEAALKDDPIAAFIEDYTGFVAHNPHWALFVIRASSQDDEMTGWLARTCLRPVVEALFMTITRRPWPTGGTESTWAVSLVTLLTGASVVFAQRSLVAELSTIDTRSSRFIHEHARSITLSVKALLAAHC